MSSHVACARSCRHWSLLPTPDIIRGSYSYSPGTLRPIIVGRGTHRPLGRRPFTGHLTWAGRPYLEDRPDYRRGDVGGTDGCILAAHRSQRRLCLPALCGRAAGRSGRSHGQGKGIAALSGSHRTPPLARLQVTLRRQIYSGKDGALGAALLKMSFALPARMNAQFELAGGCDSLKGMPPGRCG